MAQTVKILHSDFGAERSTQNKSPYDRSQGAFESIYYCSRFVFFALAGLLRESPPPDPKPQPLLHTSAGDESVAMLFR